MNYTTYDSLGKITGNYWFGNADNATLNLAGKTYIVGDYSAATHYLNNGLPVTFPVKPTSDHLEYQFDYATKTWVVDQAQSRHNIAVARDQLINEVESIGAVQWASLSSVEQQQLTQYRQQLLAYTVTGTVTEPVWPNKPNTLF
jgi:hypothetical protein